jgi:hypothetical protein
MTDSYLFDAGWLFLAAWGAIIVAVSLAAFGRDLLDGRALFDSTHATRLPDLARPTQSSPRTSSSGAI